MSDSKTPYLDAASASLPSILSDLILSFDVFSREKLDTLVRFCMGGSCPERIQGYSGAWLSGQDRLRSRFQQIEPQSLGKRIRDGELNGDDGPSTLSKKQKVDDTDDGEDGMYTLHSISATSPVRKKVHITITPSTIRLTNPSTNALESRIDLASIRRAFILSNMGKNKNKPRWSVVLISADTSDKKDASSQLQLTFAVDHAPSNAKDLFTITQSGEMTAHPKGTETFSFLQSFLGYLPPHILFVTSPDPTRDVQPFLSTAAQPYVEAYRQAKEGALYLLESGILWAESKPAEFFALEDLAPDSDEIGMGGVKTLSATGRTFSLFVRRRDVRPRNDDGVEMDVEEDEMLEGEETEFAMIDGREQENVLQWVRRYRRLFGKPQATAIRATQQTPNGDAKGKGKAKATADEVAAMNMEDEGSDASDVDYVAPSDTDGGEPSSESDSDAESGGGGDGDEEGGEDSSEESEEEEEEEELDPARHPLMRPGAMPRMSQAAMDAAVRMVVGDVVEQNDDEEDELE